MGICDLEWLSCGLLGLKKSEIPGIFFFCNTPDASLNILNRNLAFLGDYLAKKQNHLSMKYFAGP